MSLSEKKKKSNEKYLKLTFDEIKLRVKKGQKAELQEHASVVGESLNAFINRAINQAVERDKAIQATPTDTDPVSEEETEKSN